MDPLTQLLTQRVAAQQPAAHPPQSQVQPIAPQVPSVPPASAGRTNTPPELQRYINAQNMMQAYRNNWTPNPIIMQAQSRGSPR